MTYEDTVEAMADKLQQDGWYVDNRLRALDMAEFIVDDKIGYPINS